MMPFEVGGKLLAINGAGRCHLTLRKIANA